MICKVILKKCNEFSVMYLKRIEISGFKSFANKTKLEFNPDLAEKSGNNFSVTAIVGPNGSGKSNVVDAMRWVMGEQSMKNLRGKKSEDIIFAGSNRKARLGSAEVSLFFDNSDKKIPLEFEDVSITRKIFRSGEGEYRINGSKVRLQDVVDLMAKAGVGKDGYSIITQGMADSVLSATPMERRSIIEDAAGVKQYQIKKERSIRKMETTRDNLEKARSLAEEIKPHLNLLKRQAEKAKQGEKVSQELKEKQTRLYTYLWGNFQKEKAGLEEAKEEMGRKMMNAQREADKLSDEMGKRSREGSENVKLAQLEKKAYEIQNQLHQRDLIVNEGRIEIEKEKRKNMEIIEEIKIASVAVDLKYVASNLEEIKRDQERLVRRIESVEKLEELQDIKEFARVIQQRLHDLRADVEKGKIETVKKEEVKSKKKEENSFSEEIKKSEAKAAELRNAVQKSESELKEIRENITSEIQLDRKRRQDFFELERALRIRQDELGKLKDQFNEGKVALARVEVHEEDLRALVLAELKIRTEELEGSVESVDRIILEKEINRLKLQMEQIGGIDPLVVEEYEETSKRFEFLTRESSDLEKAMVSLKEIIKELDRKISEEFRKAFLEIDREFTHYFRIIFGGGNAGLKKVEIAKRFYKHKEGELDEASEEGAEEESGMSKSETGIDISACPPGKRIAHLSMLSGGERSLTSLALLFAIISYNSPPFVVLDEVEAALDEANSKRFGKIIQELSHSTQFVVVTHNRETMRQASLLYGVTMGEDGISKVLSVRLDQVGQGGKILKE